MKLVPILFFAALLVAESCCAQNLAYHQDPRWQAPQQAAVRRNPLANKPEAEAGGHKLFLRNCVECHAGDGRGLKRAANLLLPGVQSQSDGTLFWKITNGNVSRGMPSFSRLPELQRWQLVLYLRQLGAQPTQARKSP